MYLPPPHILNRFVMVVFVNVSRSHRVAWSMSDAAITTPFNDRPPNLSVHPLHPQLTPLFSSDHEASSLGQIVLRCCQHLYIYSMANCFAQWPDSRAMKRTYPSRWLAMAARVCDLVKS